MKKLSDNIERKFIDSVELDEYEILTDTGWEDCSFIHKTIPYDEYEIVLEDKNIIVADTHIFFDENMEEIFAKDCQNQLIQTVDGPTLVKSVIKNGRSSNMFDVSVESDNHRYFTNDILSHNSVTSIGWLLWFVLFNSEKQVGILANKGFTAREMLSRITLMLENIPFFLQPGCKELNKGSIKFSNNSKIIAAATSSSSIRGLSLNCVTGDTEVTVMNDDDNVIRNINIIDLYNENNGLLKANSFDNIKSDFHEFEHVPVKLLETTLFNEGKYLKCYESLIEKARHKMIGLDEKTEKHHIIPKSLGGSDDDTNIVELRLREHFFVHKLLVKITRGRNKSSMLRALYMMSNTRGMKLPSTTYASCRESMCEMNSTRIWTTESKLKNSKSKIDYWKSINREHLSQKYIDSGRNEKISKALTGKKKTVEQINKNPVKIEKSVAKHRGMKRSDIANRKCQMQK